VVLEATTTAVDVSIPSPGVAQMDLRTWCASFVRRRGTPSSIATKGLTPLFRVLKSKSLCRSPTPTPMGSTLLTMNFHQSSHKFTFGVGINLISYPMVLTPSI
jgi:hypothetical protein